MEEDRILKLQKQIERLKKSVKKQRYGLVWMDIPEAFEDDVENKLPILKEVPELAIKNDNGKPIHILIEGDNYHALTCLNYTHKGKIDIIYIDPPYNTGSDGFRYKDKRIIDKFPDGTLVPKDHPFRHSYWLSFMKKRLELAADLLKDSGVIFISIGEDEVANLKLLSDEVFGESNLLSHIARIAKTASNKGNYFAPSIDFVLVYAKNVNLLTLFKDEVNEKLYTKKDENGFYRDDVALYQAALDPMRGCSNQRYFIECPDGELVIPPGQVMPEGKKDAAFVKPQSSSDKVWRWSYTTYLEKKNLLVYKKTKRSPLLNQEGNRAKWNIYTKSYLEERSESGTAPRNFLDEFINRKGADFLKTLDINFSYPKPVDLIKHLIRITNKDKDIIILDFFAGSGTTGQAVMELNQEDDGSRQFIMVTNNEDNIMSEVCYPRIQRIINGYKNQKGEKFDGFGNSLKYYKTAFVGRNSILNTTDDDKVELAHNAGELLAIAENTLELVKQNDHYQLFEDSNKDKYTAIYFREELEKFDDFVEMVKRLQKKTTVYVFSWGNEELSSDFAYLKGVKIKTIPLPILEIYKNIYNLE